MLKTEIKEKNCNKHVLISKLKILPKMIVNLKLNQLEAMTKIWETITMLDNN